MKKVLLILCLMLLIVSVISGCSKEKTINETTEKDTGVITETTAETETTTEKVVETEAPTQKPTEAPKPTEKPTEKPTQRPTEALETQPSGGGSGLDMSDAGKGPNTDHVGGESSEEIKDANDQLVDDMSWDLDWELN